MKAKQWLLLVLLVLWGTRPAQAKPSVFDLVGRWESMVEFGKVKFNLIVKIAKTSDGKVEAKIDIPEQGARDIPVNAMLFNHPAVRWEIDPFNTAFNGKVNEGATEIAGAFEEGPGGRPIALVFKRVNSADAAETKRVYTFTAGEPKDFRGFWEGTVESEPGTKSRIGLKIGRGPDGTFAADLDLFDRGALGLPATSVKSTNSDLKLEWQLFQITFEGKLGSEGNQLAGNWKGRGRTFPVTLQRLEQAATAMPANISFIPKQDAPEDIRGEWQGTLAVQGNKLRLIIRVGQTPDGTFAGTLASPDQGGGEIPISSVGYTNPVVRVEWKGIGGVFEGKLNSAGTSMEGSWKQGGSPLDLTLARTTANGVKAQ